MGRGVVIENDVLRYLQQHLGEMVNAADIAADVGGAKSSVQRIMNSLVQKGHAEVIARGNMYIFRGITEKSCGLYEYLATLKSGAILVQDEDGHVYKLTEME